MGGTSSRFRVRECLCSVRACFPAVPNMASAIGALTSAAAVAAAAAPLKQQKTRAASLWASSSSAFSTLSFKDVCDKSKRMVHGGRRGRSAALITSMAKELYFNHDGSATKKMQVWMTAAHL